MVGKLCSIIQTAQDLRKMLVMDTPPKYVLKFGMTAILMAFSTPLF